MSSQTNLRANLRGPLIAFKAPDHQRVVGHHLEHIVRLRMRIASCQQVNFMPVMSVSAPLIYF